MSNSIDIKNIEVSNSIHDLSFLWKALFKNGDYIFQLEDGIEHRFQEVKDRFNELQFFYLYNKNNPNDKFIVDLENGFIFKNEIKDCPEIIEKKENIRLIYFRRRRKKISTQDLKEVSQKIWYFLGFQWNDKKNNNYKIVLKINESGNWILGE